MNTQFKRWDDNEEKQLLKEIQQGLQVYQICKIHERSKKAIEIRLQDIAIRMLSNGLSYDKIKEQTSITEEQIIARKNQIKQEQEAKTRLGATSNFAEQPFRQMNMPSQETLNAILKEIRELKNAFREMSEQLKGTSVSNLAQELSV